MPPVQKGNSDRGLLIYFLQIMESIWTDLLLYYQKLIRTIVRALHESEKLTALKIRSERRADFSAKEQQGPPLLLIMPYLQLLSYPATIFSEKYRRIGSIDQGYLRRYVANINIIQYGHGNILKSGFKGIQIIMFSRVAYVGCSTSADKNTI